MQVLKSLDLGEGAGLAVSIEEGKATDAKPTYRYLFRLDERIGDFALVKISNDENGVPR